METRGHFGQFQAVSQVRNSLDFDKDPPDQLAAGIPIFVLCGLTDSQCATPCLGIVLGAIDGYGFVAEISSSGARIPDDCDMDQAGRIDSARHFSYAI